MAKKTSQRDAGRRGVVSSSSPPPPPAATTTTTQPPSTVSSTTSPHQPSLSLWQIIRHSNSRKAIQLVALAAIYSPISQLTLGPVYGSVPSALYHRYALVGCIFLGYGLRGYLPPWIHKVIPGFCFWIPCVQFLLFQISSTLGTPFGPLITELLTLYPLVTLSVYAAIELFDDLDLNTRDNPAGEAAPAMGLFVLFQYVQRTARNWIPQYIGSNILFTRIGFQLLIAILYAFTLPVSYLWPAFPAMAFTLIGNPHAPLERTTEVMANTLALYDYTLLERHESITGYISVLQNNQKGFRVMRCDHSLLGGEWLQPSTTPDPARKVADPIYAIFTMLEAVRLVEPCTPDAGKRALNIGVGIGTAPSALIMHGINTTILELDPTVYHFAVKYFNLPLNHSVYIADAADAVASLAQNPAHKASYDYIIHDVFTGGAEPATLFTIEFLEELRNLMTPKGVIAINYAGDLGTPSSAAASLVYRTINSVFPSCRIFREDAAPIASSSSTADFTNTVFFCHKPPFSKSPDGGAISFRKPLEADFLGSNARREFLLPQHEIDAKTAFQRHGEVLTRRNLRALEKWHAQSAMGHWRVMRTVLPAGVWETW